MVDLNSGATLELNAAAAAAAAEASLCLQFKDELKWAAAFAMDVAVIV